MRLNCETQGYFLSACDISVMSQAGITAGEILQYKPKHPGLPPLWSRVPYMMLFNWMEVDTKLFWKAYRELDHLIKNADSHYTPA